MGRPHSRDTVQRFRRPAAEVRGGAPTVLLLSSEPYAFRQRHVDDLLRTLPVPKPVLLADGEMLSWYGNRAIAGLRYLMELRMRIDARIA